MSDGLKILFVFVDGLGIGGNDPTINPLAEDRFPTLNRLLRTATPLDACLGVEGLPQSATGQAALLTGINAPKAMGRHIEGFPPPALKALIEEDNLFKRLTAMGKRCTFANSYLNIEPEQIPPRRRSVTTVMTLSALGNVRGTAELEAGRAVTHDITRSGMTERGYTGPHVSPEEAAGHLTETAEENDLTLFEHFLTDRAGHLADRAHSIACLETLERFITEAIRFADRPNRLFIMTSDHGNIEDLKVRTHTMNPVPLVVLGRYAEQFSELTDLCDVTPAIIRLYGS
ncbi:MAG: hypothetical protein JXR25_12110 [Pontiellaceae bacterium]|nr:hypothetical protein [Pontiellaceae bacterium]MBN2785558.1 hypothetical protein [Pontiellaceae bacterium]